MATIDDVYKVTQYRASKAGYLGIITPGDFNLLFPRASIRYWNKIYANYATSERMSDSMAKFKTDPTLITIDGSGQYVFPDDMFHVDALMYGATPSTMVQIVRVEAQRLANNLTSSYEPPTTEFPIYTEYSDYLQFYPTSLGQATLIYLKKPITAVWAYTLAGTVSVYGTITPGTGYVNGTYTNVPMTGGSGTGCLANITVAGGVVTSVVLGASGGFNYKQGDVLSASNTNFGGTGSGFSVPVSAIVNARQVYDSVNSVDPEFMDTDIDNIIYELLMDLGISFRDQELESFALTQSKIQI